MMTFTSRVPLRWSDLDALGHINNATYLTLAEQGRTEAFDEALTDGWAGPQAPVLVAASLVFRRPITQAGVAVVETTFGAPGRTSLPTRFTIALDGDDGGICASGEATLVWIDVATGRPCRSRTASARVRPRRPAAKRRAPRPRAPRGSAARRPAVGRHQGDHAGRRVVGRRQRRRGRPMADDAIGAGVAGVAADDDRRVARVRRVEVAVLAHARQHDRVAVEHDRRVARGDRLVVDEDVLRVVEVREAALDAVVEAQRVQAREVGEEGREREPLRRAVALDAARPQRAADGDRAVAP